MSYGPNQLLLPRWIIPIEPVGAVWQDHAIFIQDGQIADILPQSEALIKYNNADKVELSQHVLIPGLVNLHCHAAMNLLRGIADDLPLMRWLREAIWPTEQKHVSAQFVHDGCLLAGAEMLLGGITCVNDMYFFPEACAQAWQTLNLRSVIGITVIDLPTAYASDADDYLHKGLAARDKWQNNLTRFALAPHAPYTVSDASCERINALSHELDLPIHMHIHETAQEVIDAEKTLAVRPIARLAKLGLLGPNLIGVHCVHLNDEEIELFAKNGVHVAHNPSSNMKLASGIAPIAAMLAAGVNVGLGTDGAASNNRLDIFQEMRTAALLAKVATGDAACLPAHTALYMATLGGAKAIGWDTHIGSIKAGKQADLCAIQLNTLQTQPCYDVASHLVYAAGRENVTDVWVAGKQLVKNQQFNSEVLHLSNKNLLALAQTWQHKLAT